uniref:Uncharacterized protein n=1 Tax=Timema bartmani TaxID=61472 RepID=A0A7R9F414_9NEOP|nr:unnamed protein product [Timema bartmani]
MVGGTNSAMEKRSKSTEYKSARKHFLQWAFRWACEDYEDENPTYEPPDVVDLVALLQTVGLKLRLLEKQSRDSDACSSGTGPSFRAVLMCGHSRMRAVLEAPDSKCHCPPSENADEAHIWEVSGSEPNNSRDSRSLILEAGSTMLPNLNKGSSDVIRDVFWKLVQIVSSDEHNKSEFSSVSYSQPKVKRGSSLGSIQMRERSMEKLSAPVERRYGSLAILPLTLYKAPSLSNSLAMDVEESLPPPSPLASCSISPVGDVQMNPAPPPLFRQSTWNKEDRNTTTSKSAATAASVSNFPLASLCSSVERINLKDRPEVIFGLKFAVGILQETLATAGVDLSGTGLDQSGNATYISQASMPPASTSARASSNGKSSASTPRRNAPSSLGKIKKTPKPSARKALLQSSDSLLTPTRPSSSRPSIRGALSEANTPLSATPSKFVKPRRPAATVTGAAAKFKDTPSGSLGRIPRRTSNPSLQTGSLAEVWVRTPIPPRTKTESSTKKREPGKDSPTVKSSGKSESSAVGRLLMSATRRVGSQRSIKTPEKKGDNSSRK